MFNNSSLIRLCLPALLGLGVLQAANAQTATEMTAEEMTDAFNKQKTRGLVLVPSGDQPTTTEDSATTVAAAASDYQEVEADQQVNLQIRFDYDSAALREDQKPMLVALCGAMQAADVQVFQIIGHTDSAGSSAYNESLSLLRAQEVKRHLVSDCGIDENKLEAIGMGETVPLNKQDTRADENRRVEFQALG